MKYKVFFASIFLGLMVFSHTTVFAATTTKKNTASQQSNKKKTVKKKVKQTCVTKTRKGKKVHVCTPVKKKEKLTLNPPLIDPNNPPSSPKK